MPLPIIIIFENHWDHQVKSVIKNDVLADLIQVGYNTYCFETPHDLNEQQLFSKMHEAMIENDILLNQAKTLIGQKGLNLASDLEDLPFEELASLLRLYVSSRDFTDMATIFKQIKSNKLTLEIFESVLKKYIYVQGIDQPCSVNPLYVPAKSKPLYIGALSNEDPRSITLATNIHQLYKKGRGLIVVLGAFHAKATLHLLANQGLADNIIYYFLHSNTTLSRLDLVNVVKQNCDTLQKATFVLDSPESGKEFRDSLLAQIKRKNIAYECEIKDEPPISYLPQAVVSLRSTFKQPFLSFRRSGYYVDAVLKIDQADDESTMISKTLDTNGIPYLITKVNDSNMLTIPDINTPVIGEKIANLKFT